MILLWPPGLRYLGERKCNAISSRKELSSKERANLDFSSSRKPFHLAWASYWCLLHYVWSPNLEVTSNNTIVTSSSTSNTWTMIWWVINIEKHWSISVFPNLVVVTPPPEQHYSFLRQRGTLQISGTVKYRHMSLNNLPPNNGPHIRGSKSPVVWSASLFTQQRSSI